MDGLWLSQRYHNHSEFMTTAAMPAQQFVPQKYRAPSARQEAVHHRTLSKQTSILGSPWIAVIAAVPVNLCYCFCVIGQWRAGLLLLPSNHQ
ncbi:hypothetical protein ABKV19_017118, partial [Rosa sericea]